MQEDPFKLVAIGKDYQGRGTMTADFLIHEGRMCFVTSDVHGVARLIEYNPASKPASSRFWSKIDPPGRPGI